MKIISPNRPVHAVSGDFTDCYRPFTRYVVSDWEYLNLLNNTEGVQWECSSFNPFERRYGGQDLTNKKVVVYRHTAYGDQLMISAVPRYLKTLYPNSTVHFYCDAGMRNLWDNNPFVGGSAIPVPMTLDSIKQYDYHLFYEIGRAHV